MLPFIEVSSMETIKSKAFKHFANSTQNMLRIAFNFEKLNQEVLVSTFYKKVLDAYFRRQVACARFSSTLCSLFISLIHVISFIIYLSNSVLKSITSISSSYLAFFRLSISLILLFRHLRFHSIFSFLILSSDNVIYQCHLLLKSIWF